MKPTQDQNDAAASKNIELIVYKINEIKSDVVDIKTKLESNYATKEWCEAQFGQTKKLVNGLIVTFGSAIVLAIAAFILRGGLK